MFLTLAGIAMMAWGVWYGLVYGFEKWPLVKAITVCLMGALMAVDTEVVIIVTVSLLVLTGLVTLFVCWYDSPKQIAIYEQKHNDFLRRAAANLADMPDYPSALRLKRQLEKRGSKEATVLLVWANALLAQMRKEAETAALAGVEKELRGIEFRTNPQDAEIPKDRVLGD